MKDPIKIQETLDEFSASLQWYRWSALFPKDLLTDGALFVANECQAYWLMDAIASWQYEKKVRVEEFQVWRLNKDSVNSGGHWRLLADDGNENEIARQGFKFSNFPINSIKLYAVRNELGGVTVMLPGEY